MEKKIVRLQFLKKEISFEKDWEELKKKIATLPGVVLAADWFLGGTLMEAIFKVEENHLSDAISFFNTIGTAEVSSKEALAKSFINWVG
jgi:hypothetical protein